MKIYAKYNLDYIYNCSHDMGKNDHCYIWMTIDDSTAKVEYSHISKATAKKLKAIIDQCIAGDINEELMVLCLREECEKGNAIEM